jgi:copper homeostasis protein (lipoprotein)
MKSTFIPSLLFATLIVFSACNSTQKSTSSNKNESIEAIVENPDPAHNSQNSLDWAGIYKGTIPCADCEGIITVIKMEENLTVTKQTQYLGKSDKIFTSTGKMNWLSDGGRIELIGEDFSKEFYRVGENVLIQLDQNGKKIEGNLATHYHLSKIESNVYGKYWKLVELYGQPIESKNAKSPFLILSENENRAYGNAGCNSFSGTYALEEGNRISITKIATTLMACEDMAIEEQFKSVLEMTDNYYVSANQLHLHKAKMAPLAKFEADFFQKVE